MEDTFQWRTFAAEDTCCGGHSSVEDIFQWRIISEEDVLIEDTAKKDGNFVRCARRIIPSGLNFDDLWRLGLRIMYCVQSHFKCTFTCFKNKAYSASCRMAKPSALSPLTKIFHLIPVRNDLGEHELPTRSVEIPDPPEEDVFPAKGQ